MRTSLGRYQSIILQKGTKFHAFLPIEVVEIFTMK